MTSGIYLIDVITLALQLFYYREYIREQSGKSQSVFSVLMTDKYLYIPRESGESDAEYQERFMRAKLKQHHVETATKKF